MPDQHVITQVSTEWNDGRVTAYGRCACGIKRQAGSFAAYPGHAGAVVLLLERLDCGHGPLRQSRRRHPIATDPASLEDAAATVDRESARLREEAARLMQRAGEYEAAAGHLRADLLILSREP